MIEVEADCLWPGTGLLLDPDCYYLNNSFDT